MIEPSLISYLAGDSAISARVVDRIYPEILPQNTILPAISFTRISSQHPELLDGDPSLSFAQFQISCWADTAKLTAEVAACVRIRMQGVGGSNFQKVSIDDERSDYEPDTLLYRQDLDLTIAYSESSP